jgi:hypothetical protein
MSNKYGMREAMSCEPVIKDKMIPAKSALGPCSGAGGGEVALSVVLLEHLHPAPQHLIPDYLLTSDGRNFPSGAPKSPIFKKLGLFFIRRS